MGQETSATIERGAKSQTATIAAQNDQFRQTICNNPANPGPLQGQVFVTPGIDGEGQDFVMEAITAVGAYDSFTVDADPYGLHEMGVITIHEKRVWWRIDLYDRNYEYGAENPIDPEETRRVLTILFPSEY